MAHHKTLFVFDIETVPDLEAARNLLGDKIAEGDLRQALVDYHLEVTAGKNDFIRQLFHKVVAISFLEAEIHKDEEGYEYYVLKDIRSGGKVDSSERELIQGLFHYLSTLKPRFVSFNGKTFDMPVLKYRAMKHQVSARWLYHSGDKWNNYNQRYSADWHCDLLEVLSDYGQSARVRMMEVCALLGLPGKIDVDGSKVEDLYNQGKVQEIRDYCELDVINTYLLYLRHMHHTGSLKTDAYNIAVEDLEAFLEAHAGERENFSLFLESWKR
jgi:predicted PolB exonuclease-like 3'-5' exonuclease